MYVEGAHERKQLVQSGREFKGVPLAATILERGSKTPWISPHEMAKMGFYMILFPTTILFRVTRAIQRGLQDLNHGQPLPVHDSVPIHAGIRAHRGHPVLEVCRATPGCCSAIGCLRSGRPEMRCCCELGV